MEYLKKVQMDNLAIDTLPEDRRNKIIELKNSLRLDDESIMNFGSSATKKLSDSSATMLNSIKLKDFPEINVVVGELMGELKKVDSNTLLTYKPNFFQRLFEKECVQKFVAEFEGEFKNASGVIEIIKKKLEDAKYQLKKDMVICDQCMNQTVEYINDLDDCIFAGRMKLQEFKNELDQELSSVDINDTLSVHMLNERQNAINRLEINLQDHSLIRENSIQTLCQLGLIKNGDAALIEKINKSITMAIPLWQSQMLVAFVITRSQNAADIEKAISDTSNAIIVSNAEAIKSGAIKIATEMQRGIIDIDTLKTSSKKLIETFEEVKKINIQGKQNRLKAIEELQTVSTSLNQATLLIEGK